MSSTAVIRDLTELLGRSGVLHARGDIEKYERGYRYGSGRALAVVRPSSLEELRSIVRYCYAHDLRMIAQGANTALVGASTPDESGAELVVSLDRFRGIEVIDVQSRTACVLAGTRLSELNSGVAGHQLYYPIDLGADPSLGGMVATNTGGARLLRYGDVQRNLLGLEVILADADASMLTDLHGLRKDNSGVDLKQLFVGTSGSFGIISRAQVELHRVPRQTAAALVVPASHAAVLELLTLLEMEAGEFLGAFEGMSANAMEAAFAHNRRLQNPFAADGIPPYAVLVELVSTLQPNQIDLSELLALLLGRVMEAREPAVKDAYLGRGEDFWALRHSISDGLRAAGTVIGFDVSLPRARLAECRADLVASVAEQYPQMLICDFGHCADGGDHFNLVWPTAAGCCDASEIDALRELVYDRIVRKYGGSFSAEHGVGPHNISYYRRYTSSVDRTMAGHLKRLCDPKGLLGRVDFS